MADPASVPSMPDSCGDPYRWLERSLAALHRADRYRQVHPVEGPPGPVVQVGGMALANFASNDYLGLAGDPRLAAAATAAIATYGTSATGSRLLSGHRPLHQQLETALAQLKGTEAALVFSSGYLANVGTVAALVGAPDLILTDEYNHSSLRSGAALSGATVVSYPHGDMAALGQQLQHHRSHHRRCLILTDSVFSMDGDLCPLPDLLALATAHEAMVLVDEAHATGVLGATGAGCGQHFGCTGQPLVQVGTLSKALGSLGGYVAGSATLIDFLRNRAPGWIYTTGLSPADTAAALAAVQMVQQDPQRRQALWDNVAYVQQQLSGLVAGWAGVRRIPSQSPIICLELASAAAVLAAAAGLRQRGVWVAAVRPPTVPTSRLRITVMATHRREHLDALVAALGAVLPTVVGAD